MQLDDIDIRIADELRSNALQTSNQLSEKLGISASAIRRRKANLIKQKMLKIIGMAHPVSLGYVFWANIGLKVVIDKGNKVMNKLVPYPCLYMVSKALGRYDIIIGARFKSLDEMNHFIFGELPTIEGILSTETHLLAEHKKYFDYLWENES